MKSLRCYPEPDHKQFPGRCLDQFISKNDYSTSTNTLIQKKKFYDPLLPKNININTTFGIKTIGDTHIGDVIFPNKSTGEIDNENDINKKELYKISHHSYEPGEQINRRYATSFIQDQRYGRSYKRLPAGIWYTNNVVSESSNEDKNIILNILKAGHENEHCRYPYIDHRQGKFPGRSYFKVEDVITNSEPDEKQFELMEYLAAINKIKYAVIRKKDSLKLLRETYKQLDKEFTGWLPLEQVYTICYQHQIWPEKKLFDLALNSIDAINNNDVRYDLFADLLDPNVNFTPSFEIVKKDYGHPIVSTYKNDFDDKLFQSVEQNKNLGYDHIYTPVKPIISAHQNCIGYETNVKTLLNPTIYSNYGLTYKDFYIGRSKDTIDKLYRDIGVNLPCDIFNVIWNNAYRCGGNEDKVSIEVFRQALQDYFNRNTNSRDNESDD